MSSIDALFELLLVDADHLIQHFHALEAIQKGDIANLQTMLTTAEPTMQVNYNQGKLFAIAVRNGQLEMVKLLYQHGASMSVVSQNRNHNPEGLEDSDWDNAIYQIVKMEHLHIMEFLIDHGIIDIDIQLRFQNTPLFIACIRGDIDMVKYLLQKGADLHKTNLFGRKPLFYTALHGRVELTTLLLMSGADVDCVNEEGSTPLHGAIVGRQSKCAALLVEHGANVLLENHDGDSPLVLAFKKGNWDALFCIIKSRPELWVRFSKLLSWTRERIEV